ncbi:MAG: type III-B CRISPR module-associated protein Cmr5 [Candidatus Pacebacteria bacterium]|nr:type III-B CRISPR module-associated protein Cmr5 [Candidatus Paceibacterota bacterium]
MKKTLDQIRAAVAIQTKDEILRSQGGSDKSKSFPTMVQTNGLLGALAFAIDKKTSRSEAAFYSIASAVVAHLNEVRKQDKSIMTEDIQDPECLAKYLAKTSTPTQFRRITAECLAFLNYLRRFVS